jgi:RNA polymerase sigma factor for flagellar operon FliA
MADEELIDRHQHMVRGLACRLRRELGIPSEIDDLVAFGFGGLLEARRRFDPARGVRFQTYAYHRIRGAMLDGVRKMADVPRRAHQRLASEQQIEPTAAPTALDKSFARARNRMTGPSPLQSEYGTTSPESAVLRDEAITRLLEALSTLSPRERRIVRGRYFEGEPLETTATELGVSKSWASRLHAQTLSKLRALLDNADTEPADRPKSHCSR